MGFITDIEWEGTGTFEEIVVWFIDPMRVYLEMFDKQFVEPNTILFEEYKVSPAETRACFFYYEMKNKLNDLSKLLYRLADDYRKNPIPEKPKPVSDESKKAA